MFKKLLAIGLSLSLILASGSMAALAESGATISQGGTTSVDDNIKSKESYGAKADPVEADSASVDVSGNVSVDYNGPQETDAAPDADVSGAEAVADGDKEYASVTVDGNVDVKNTEEGYSNVSGAMAKSSGNNADTSVKVEGNVNVTSTTGEKKTIGAGAVAIGDDADAITRVGGNVDVKSTDGSVSGIIASAEGAGDTSKNNTAIVEVTGDVSATSTNDAAVGIEAGANTNNFSSVNVEGKVSATSTKGDSTGIRALAFGEDATVNVEVKGEVKSSTNGTAEDEAGSVGIFVENSNGGSVTITLKDGLTVTGPEENTSGILVASGLEEENSDEFDTSTKINIEGDLTSSGSGIMVNQPSGKVDVVIDGTLKTESEAVLLDRVDEENLSITVWKIESGNDKLVGVSKQLDDAEPAEKTETVSEDTRKAVEEAINYIIRIKDDDKKYISSLDNAKNNGDFYTATVKDTVTVKVNIPDNLRILNVYSDENQKVILSGNAKDGFTLTIPRGGGVSISLSLAEKENNNNNNSNNNDNYDNDSGNDDGKDNTPKQNNYIGNIRIDSISENDYNFDENTGILTIAIPRGTNAFNLDSSVLLLFMEKGMNTLFLNTVNGNYTIPIVNIKDLIIPGNVFTFVIGEQKLNLFIGLILQRDFYPDVVG